MDKLYSILVLAAVLMLAGCTQTAPPPAEDGEAPVVEPPPQEPPPQEPPQEPPAQEPGDGGVEEPAKPDTGRAVFSITDAAANMESVTGVMVTVDSVRVHSEAQGWVTVSEESQTYDLLKLKATGTAQLLADVEIQTGTYNQLRLDISNVTVIDAEGEHEALLPSNELLLIGMLEVKADATATTTFDFIADESLHVTGDGTYVLAPVVRLETRSNAQVSVDAGNTVSVTGGRVDTDAELGMGLDGAVGVGVRVPVDAEINIGAGGGLTIGGNGRVVIGITDAAADLENVTKLEVAIEQVRVRSQAGNWTSIAGESQVVDLLELQAQNRTQVLADAELPAGDYTEIELTFGSATIIDTDGTHQANLPGTVFVAEAAFNSQANGTAAVTFDILANQSLHQTEEGNYVFAPVANVDAHSNAAVTVSEDGALTIQGGDKVTVKIGMDEQGNVGVDISIPTDANLNIGAGGGVTIRGGVGVETG